MWRAKALAFALVGMFLIGITASRVSSQNGVTASQNDSSESLVKGLRMLNTVEAEYMHQNGRFAAREELLSYIRSRELANRGAINWDNPQPYEVAITTSPDAKRYQIALKHKSSDSDMNDQTCRSAAFTDEAAIIYVGSAIGCVRPTP